MPHGSVQVSINQERSWVNFLGEKRVCWSTKQKMTMITMLRQSLQYHPHCHLLPSCLLSSLQLPYQEPDNPSFYPWKTAVTCFVQEIKTLNSRVPVWLPTLMIHNNQGLSKRRMITPWNLIPNQQMMLERELSNTSQQQNPCMPIIFGDYSHL